jgi:hypothetical protein
VKGAEKVITENIYGKETRKMASTQYGKYPIF